MHSTFFQSIATRKTAGKACKQVGTACKAVKGFGRTIFLEIVRASLLEDFLKWKKGAVPVKLPSYIIILLFFNGFTSKSGNFLHNSLRWAYNATLNAMPMRSYAFNDQPRAKATCLRLLHALCLRVWYSVLSPSPCRRPTIASKAFPFLLRFRLFAVVKGTTHCETLLFRRLAVASPRMCLGNTPCIGLGHIRMHPPGPKRWGCGGVAGQQWTHVLVDNLCL